MQKARFVFSAALAIFLFLSNQVFARENVTDWYIKDFSSEIVVNKDGSLNITEKIMADTGSGVNKHGIFRILPTSTNINSTKVKNPVELISITNEKGKPYKFEEKNSSDTVTWKIGDPNISVVGVNNYYISYKVKNAIRFQKDFDELYWNLNGNFWDLEIDNFKARIIFPPEISSKNANVEYYTGFQGDKKKDAKYSWINSNTIEFLSMKALAKREGITASITFPKNIITPTELSFWERYGQYIYFLIPIFVFIICFLLWRKYGDDPEYDKTVIAQYDIPNGLSPLELGMLMRNGKLDQDSIAAEIIFLANKGLIEIKEIEKKFLFITSKDYELTQKRNPEIGSTLSGAQQKLLSAIFEKGETIELSSLKNDFYHNLPALTKLTKSHLVTKGFIQSQGISIGKVIIVLSGILFWPAILSFMKGNYSISIAFIAAGIIMQVFGLIMPRRTLLGTEANWKAKGFKLFLNTVDKDRAPFYERENIFYDFLPYAILFGMTDIWIKKVGEIYGNDYFTTHAPLWFVGNSGSFDTNAFSSSIESLATSISSNTSAPSGSGGAGSAGGGGGGGGGGGW